MMTVVIALGLPMAAEAWTAVLGGLIPIVGLVAIGWIVIRAARDGDSGDAARSEDREDPE
jgi:hypothetical protein